MIHQIGHRVYYRQGSQWMVGRVMRYDRSTGKYLVALSDGERESWFSDSELQPLSNVRGMWDLVIISDAPAPQKKSSTPFLNVIAETERNGMDWRQRLN